MRQQRKNNIIFLLLNIITFFAFIALILFIPPTQHIVIFTITIPVIYGFFALLFLFVFSTTTYFMKNKTRGLLLGLFPISLLLLRLNNLTHPFFLILLTALFVMLFLLVQKR